jgi:hypothetical protein
MGRAPAAAGRAGQLASWGGDLQRGGDLRLGLALEVYQQRDGVDALLAG